MASSATVNRMQRELQLIAADPPHGVSCWPVGDSMMALEAQITGPEGTPYDGGTFSLEIIVPSRYPFEPPKVRFTTPVFHPNIDSSGRICLDSLKQRPTGSWSPSINFGTLLSQIRLLLGTPNPDDGLMPDITEMYIRQPALFREKAIQCTREHACGAGESGDGGADENGGGADENAGGADGNAPAGENGGADEAVPPRVKPSGAAAAAAAAESPAPKARAQATTPGSSSPRAGSRRSPRLARVDGDGAAPKKPRRS